MLDDWPAEDARAFVAGMERFVAEHLAGRDR
jgi:hypothetical protein